MRGVAAAPHRQSRSAARGRLLVEALLVVRLLSRGRWRVEEVSAELSLHRRTVYRILAGLREVGLEVERHGEGPEVYWRIRSASFDRWRKA